jgi:hypothetical protein
MPESIFQQQLMRKGVIFPKNQCCAHPDKAAKKAYLLGGLTGTA